MERIGKPGRLVVTGAAAGAALLLLKESGRVMAGVEKGMRLCTGAVVPSLLLFMILADFLTEADLSPALFWPVRLICRLFRVPGETAPVIAVSMIGGYPAGARMVGNLVRQGRMDIRTGEKLMCSCVCCSPAFLAGAVGAGVFGDSRFGLMLYGCQLAATVLTGVLAGWLVKGGRSGDRIWEGEKDYAACFVKAVNGAGKAVLSVCLFVLVFSAAAEFLLPLPGGEILAGMMEVTVGCGGLSAMPLRRAVLLAVVYTSFGGACVWMQLYCFLKGSGVRLGWALIFRAVHCGFSLLLSWWAVRRSGMAAEVFSSFSEPLAGRGSSSVTAAVSLIALCLMLVLTLPRRAEACPEKDCAVGQSVV
ncbi:MAG: hypothetical protein IKM31_02255 [Oscillospiraceae bacterium]|nr:hypothetical protein [Oscillospiraceae bacterium]